VRESGRPSDDLLTGPRSSSSSSSSSRCVDGRGLADPLPLRRAVPSLRSTSTSGRSISGRSTSGATAFVDHAGTDVGNIEWMTVDAQRDTTSGGRSHRCRVQNYIRLSSYFHTRREMKSSRNAERCTIVLRTMTTREHLRRRTANDCSWNDERSIRSISMQRRLVIHVRSQASRDRC